MTRDAALLLVARPVLAILWALVAWGSLLLVVMLGNVVGDGVRPALAAIVPARGDSTWSWLNALSAALALAAWLAAAGICWARRSSAGRERPGT